MCRSISETNSGAITGVIWCSSALSSIHDEGSRFFRESEDIREFRSIISRTVQNIRAYSRAFQNIPEHSGILRNVRKEFGTFGNISDHLWNIPEHFRIKCSGTLRTIQMPHISSGYQVRFVVVSNVSFLSLKVVSE